MGLIAAARDPLLVTDENGVCAGIIAGDTVLRAQARTDG